MQVRRRSDGKVLTLDRAATVGAGGEATIYRVPYTQSLVAKVYHRPEIERAKKLAVMIANPPADSADRRKNKSIAWPTDLLQAGNNDQVVGFLMPHAANTRRIFDFYNPTTRKKFCPWFDYFRLHRTARNLAAAVRAIHERGYVIADVNESNVLVEDTSLVTLVDTDSFQVRDSQTGHVFRCSVGRPEFTPPQGQEKSFLDFDRSPADDLFGLSVLIYQLLMEGSHPFMAVFNGRGEPPPLHARIAAGHFVYRTQGGGNFKPAAHTPPFEILHPELRRLFVCCFEDGHSNPNSRPTAATWQSALAEAEASLNTCGANPQHRYGKHLSACPWCQRTKQLGGRDPFPDRKVAAAQIPLAIPRHARSGPRHSVFITGLVLGLTLPLAIILLINLGGTETGLPASGPDATATSSAPAAAPAMDASGSRRAAGSAPQKAPPGPTSAKAQVPPEDKRGTAPAAVALSAEDHIKRAQALLLQRKYADALRECDRALKLEPNNAQALELRSRIERVKILLP